ncbi:hypothetical protein BFP70_04205 [Thioclava sp. SK-1]|nr:hypothetical protein BFP70_04205 [Thioclava sp. SK-1]
MDGSFRWLYSDPPWHIAMPFGGAIHTINGGQGLVVEHAVGPPVCRPVLDEIIGPDLVRPFSPQPHAGAIRQPKPPAFLLFLRHFKPFAPPNPLDPLVVDAPSRLNQQAGDLPIALPSIFARQFGDVGRQKRFVLTTGRDLALGRPVLSQSPTGTALGNAEFLPDVINALTTTRRA